MASNISKAYLRSIAQRPDQIVVRALLKMSPAIALLRGKIRAFSSGQKLESKSSCQVTANFDEGGSHFREHQWVYIENILSDDFYYELITNWPLRRYFEPPRKYTKSYNTGFKWAWGQDETVLFLSIHPTLNKLFIYLRSEMFLRRVSSLLGIGDDCVCYSFHANMTIPGSQVVPHVDGVYHNEHARNFLNIIFFINGSGGEQSGALTLSRDPELRDIIFRPQKLQNSCLIYDSKASFYHGFEPVAWGKFRWAVNAQFCSRSVADKV